MKHKNTRVNTRVLEGLNGVVVNNQHSNNQSGYVCIDKLGSLSLHMGAPESLDDYESVFQSGPFVIDPGGVMGIKSESPVKADRVLLGLRDDRSLDCIFMKRVSLYEAANALVGKGYDRVLNMDGGPTGFYWVNESNSRFVKSPKMVVSTKP